MAAEPRLIEWLMLIATAGGPLVGIWVTRFIDRANDKVRRREAIFEGLIRTRGLELSPDHVSNLNMVPVLFREGSVREAYRTVMDALNDGKLQSQDEAVAFAAIRRIGNSRQDLIREIGKAVGSPLPESENERHGYAPVAWEREYAEMGRLRRALIEVAEGRQTVAMTGAIWEVDPPAGQSANDTVE